MESEQFQSEASNYRTHQRRNQYRSHNRQPQQTSHSRQVTADSHGRQSQQTVTADSHSRQSQQTDSYCRQSRQTVTPDSHGRQSHQTVADVCAPSCNDNQSPGDTSDRYSSLAACLWSREGFSRSLRSPEPILQQA